MHCVRSNLLFLLKASKMYTKPLVNSIKRTYFILYQNNVKCLNVQKKIPTTVFRNLRISRNDIDPDPEMDSDYDSAHNLEMEGFARDMLQKNPADVLLTSIYNSVSIDELFTKLNNSFNDYKSEHLTLTVLGLYDFKKIHDNINRIDSSDQKNVEFLMILKSNENFTKLLKSIFCKINSFDANTLSYTLLYLTKLGMGIEEPLIQSLSWKLEKKLIENFSISPASRFLEAVFSEAQLKSYFMAQNLIPLIFRQIDGTGFKESFLDLTVSLNKLHNVVTDDLLNKYKSKIQILIENKTISEKDYKVILQIIAFLNYPNWRDKNCVLVSKCILLLKNNLNALNIDETILLYDVFFKNQEPGEILNELQRCSSKHFHHLEDVVTSRKIKLFSTVIYFTSPHLRTGFQNTLKKYVQNCNDFHDLLSLRKLLSYIKISDINLCHLYWNKILKFLKKDSENINILNLSQNYMNFSIDIDNYRHTEFEAEILKLMENLIEDVNYKYFPQKLSNILSFVLIYGNNNIILEHLVNNLEANWQQIRPVDCLKLSLSLHLFNELDKKYIKLPFAQRIDEVLNKIITKELKYPEDLWKNNTLLKSCIFKDNVSSESTGKLLENYKDFKYLSSKNIENISYCLHVTSTLIPPVIDNVVEYIIKHKDHILGFNVGKILCLCYFLGYFPKGSLEFFNITTNIITRDQERMTGLALLQSALALSFFNHLSNSQIKSIFNVEFMDKLDNELQNCYSKEKYPQRVRSSLMQLNRAVCLDYPECNVPWFHQKYVDEHIKSNRSKNNVFAARIREYLMRIMNNTNAIKEDVVTPYGYKVDFEIDVDSSTKLAVLLIPEFYYTKNHVQLKGPYLLKKRHLEILGYKVILINFSDWICLYYAEEKIEFLKSLILKK